MTRDQLARLFPDGKTVHLPADGHRFAGYEQAQGRDPRAAARSPALHRTMPRPSPGQQRSSQEPVVDAVRRRPTRTRIAEIASSGRNTRATSASAQVASNGRPGLHANGDDNGVHAFIMAQADVARPPRCQRRASLDTRFGRRSGRARRSRPRRCAVATTQVAMATPQANASVRGRRHRFASKTATQRQSADAPTAGTPIALRSETAARTKSERRERDRGLRAAAAASAEALAEVAALVDIPLPPTADRARSPGTPTPAWPIRSQSAPSHRRAGALDHPLPPLAPQSSRSPCRGRRPTALGREPGRQPAPPVAEPVSSHREHGRRGGRGVSAPRSRDRTCVSTTRCRRPVQFALALAPSATAPIREALPFPAMPSRTVAEPKRA